MDQAELSGCWSFNHWESFQESSPLESSSSSASSSSGWLGGGWVGWSAYSNTIRIPRIVNCLEV